MSKPSNMIKEDIEIVYCPSCGSKRIERLYKCPVCGSKPYRCKRCKLVFDIYQ